MKAYDTAHCIRTIMLSNVTSQVRFKGKIGRDIKLSGRCSTDTTLHMTGRYLIFVFAF